MKTIIKINDLSRCAPIQLAKYGMAMVNNELYSMVDNPQYHEVVWGKGGYL